MTIFPESEIDTTELAGGSSSGRTTDSDSVYRGSNPRPPTNLNDQADLLPDGTENALHIQASSLSNASSKTQKWSSGVFGQFSSAQKTRKFHST